MVTYAPTSFAVRSREPELMDDLDCEDAPLLTTLDHFEIINRLFSRTSRLVRTLLLPDMRCDAREYTLIDAGCGGGDGAVRIAELCRANDIKCSIKGIDIDERTVEFARRKWRGRPGVSFQTASFLDLPTDGSAADYIVAANVLHHFADEDVPSAVDHLCKAARRGILIADLERSPFWYAAFALFASVMLRSGFSRRDGLLSIRKGFTKSEFAGIGRALPATGRVTTGGLIPCRVYLFCRKSAP
jgi:2-polyprenyl-3-methyl-5-hydroxy-6-metoxy-1,4-benzoquinol methylase